MRVAVDVTPLLGARTGIGQFVASLLAALPSVDGAPELAPFVLSARARGRTDELPAGTRVLPLPAAALVAAWRRADVPRGDRWLGPVDVAHGTNFVVPPMRRAATMVTVHDCWCVRHPETCRPDVVAAGAAMGRALRRGAWAHVGTDFMAGEVAELFGTTRVAKVPFGVPDVDGPGHAPPVPAWLGEGRFVLALGAIDPRKNLYGLVRAFARVGASDVRLVLAGPDGAGRAAVDAAVAGLPAEVARRVVVPGPVSDGDRRGLLAAASVLAYPSLHEGFGFPVLEAMAAGTPVVASCVGALPEVAGDAAVLVDPDDTDALAAALHRVLDDEALAADLVRRGLERATHFTWRATAEGLVDAWRTAAAS